MTNSDTSPFDSLNLASLMNGWFDPRVCVIFLTKKPDDTSDPRDFFSAFSEDQLDEFRQKHEATLKLFGNKLGTPEAEINKLITGRPHSYFLRPSSRSENVFGEHGDMVLEHEYTHYLQFLRSSASPLLVLATHKIVCWSALIQDALSKNAILSHRELLHLLPPQEVAFVRDVISWHTARVNFLSGADIKESEAELLSQLYGKNVYRFRRYMIGNLVTVHFRELARSKPSYARAYLEAESVLGETTAALFPLIAHFSLSMPLRPNKGTGLIGIQSAIVLPEEAFNAAINFLKNNPHLMSEYYFYAYELYKRQDIPLTAANCPVYDIEKAICESHGWEFNNVDLRLFMLELIPTVSGPFPDHIKSLFQRALDLEKELGPILFLEPWCKTCWTIIHDTIPSPPIFIPSDTPGRFQLAADPFWGEGYINAAIEIRSAFGAIWRLLNAANDENPCPHTSSCPAARANLCQDHLPHPESPDKCDFPDKFKSWFGIDLEARL